MTMASLFVADIGGTKSELAVFQEAAGVFRPLGQKRYRNSQFPGFAEVFAQFLDEFQYRPQVACIAVAGVVTGDRVQLTNLPWLIDCRALENRFGFQRVQLINDLTAVAMSIAHLGAADLAEVKAGISDGAEICGIVAPGTGLGEGLVLLQEGKVFARGTEGGHCDFAPIDDEQTALLAWMQKRQRPVSYESLIGGPGLANLYQFCRDFHGIPATPAVAAAMAAASDPIPVIVDAALSVDGEDGCPLCLRAIDLYLRILGSETGNLALKLYARGGMYLGGGIVPRLFGKVPFTGFVRSFCAKGLMGDFMQTIPVQIILRPDAALLGAAHFGRAAFAAQLLHGKRA